MNIKLCKDCKWFGNNWILPNRLQLCKNPDVISLKADSINGHVFADNARNYGPCYREAKYWESYK